MVMEWFEGGGWGSIFFTILLISNKWDKDIFSLSNSVWYDMNDYVLCVSGDGMVVGGGSGSNVFTILLFSEWDKDIFS